MSGGGGTTVQSSEPWAGVQPHLLQNYGDSAALTRGGGPDYFPGETFTRPQPEQLAPHQYGMDYMGGVFGQNFGNANYGGPQNYYPGSPQSLPNLHGNAPGPGQQYDLAQQAGWDPSRQSINQWYGGTPVQGPSGGPPGFTPQPGQPSQGGFMPGATAYNSGQVPTPGSIGQMGQPYGNSPQAMAQHQEANDAWRASGMNGNVNDFMAQNYPNLPQLNNAQVYSGGMMGGMGGQPGQPGGAPGGQGGLPDFSSMANATNFLSRGGSAAGANQAINPMMLGNLQGMFQGPQNQIQDQNFNWQSNWQPGAGASGFANDPTQAINSMLSGQPDYSAAQAATRAGAQPTLDALKEDIMPALRSRTAGSNNATGEIKDLNRIVPRVMRDITNAGTQATLGEYNRAMGSRDAAAGLAGGLGAQYSGMGLQNQGMGLDASRFGAGLGLETDMAQQSGLDRYRDQSLGLGSLGQGFMGQQSADMATGGQMMPGAIQTGMVPADMLGGYGDFVSANENLGLQDAMSRWDYNANQPYQMQDWLSGILSGAGGLGGTQTMQGAGGNPWMDLAGTGAMAAAMYYGGQ